jgi:hypothetical protein
LYGFPNIEKEYFAETVGIQDDAVIKRYIKEQRK